MDIVVLTGLEIVAGSLALLLAVTAAFDGRPPKLVAAALPRTFPGALPASAWIRIPLAVVAGLSGIGLLVATRVPFFAFFAAALAGLASLAFAAARARRGTRNLRAPAALLIAAVGVAVLQPLGLKVLLLPTADALPRRLVPATVVKTYDAGVGFESVRAGADGTLYLTANRDLDFNVPDYYRHVHAQVLARSPSGEERVLFTLPMGSTAGVFAIAPDGTLYMSSNGRTPGIWRITADGQGSLLAALPAGAWPNGLDFGPDGALYAPDSALGRIWRIDPRTGAAHAALEDRCLAARSRLALAPGANGLHFAGRDLYVTVSDRAAVYKFTLGADGRFGPAVTVATGIPGDDFAIGRDGSLFITTHPYDTLVRVAPSGERTIIGDASRHIVGATDAVFGRTPADRDTLYVATDGGAFTAGAAARGQLVALRPYDLP